MSAGSGRNAVALAYTLLAVLAGAMLPLQAAINARLGRVVVTVALTLVAAPISRPQTAGLASVPWWAWLGGLCGAITLSATTAVAPRLGTARMIALVMVGQVICSLVLDQWGLLDLAAQPFSGKRIAAAALLLAGAALMR